MARKGTEGAAAARVARVALIRALEDAGISQEQIAEAVEQSPSTVCRVIANTYPIRSVRSRDTVSRIRTLIAKKLRRPVKELFPDPAPGEWKPREISRSSYDAATAA